MAKKKKMSKKAYINLKVKNCDKLIIGATSDEQRNIYQGYRDYWIDKLPKTQNPDVIAAKEAEKEQAAIEAEATAKKEEEEAAVLKHIEEEQEKQRAVILKRIEDLKDLLPKDPILEQGKAEPEEEEIPDEEVSEEDDSDRSE